MSTHLMKVGKTGYISVKSCKMIKKLQVSIFKQLKATMTNYTTRSFRIKRIITVVK